MPNLCQRYGPSVTCAPSMNEREGVVFCSFTSIPEDLVENTLQRMQELLPTESMSGLG